MDISKGVLSQAVTIDLSRSLIDTTQCATFTELSCASNKKPYVIHTRMLFSADGAQITGIQTVLAKDGDWAFNAAGQLKCTSSFRRGPFLANAPHPPMFPPRPNAHGFRDFLPEFDFLCKEKGLRKG
jgi:hypothetical protein